MSTVVAFEVPPVVKVVRLRCAPAEAFERFTRDIDRWWPLRTHSLFRDDAAGVAFEPRVGGRLFERSTRGKEQIWGRVSAWEPPRRLAFSWHVGRSPDKAQHVELTFTPVGDGTEVRLVHSGWEALAERAAATREEYERGWNVVFVERYGDFARAETAR
jgi:uncharacterized protein YndB with AHSA1/START domain